MAEFVGPSEPPVKDGTPLPEANIVPLSQRAGACAAPSDVKWNAAPYPSSDYFFLECLRAEHEDGTCSQA